jgi:hypothetical protein
MRARGGSLNITMTGDGCLICPLRSISSELSTMASNSVNATRRAPITMSRRTSVSDLNAIDDRGNELLNERRHDVARCYAAHAFVGADRAALTSVNAARPAWQRYSKRSRIVTPWSESKLDDGWTEHRGHGSSHGFGNVQRRTVVADDSFGDRAQRDELWKRELACENCRCIDVRALGNAKT